jgi:WD40 repeat protein
MKIKLWSYANNETVRSLSFEEDITFLQRDQRKGSERLIAWGDNSISVWESDDWRGDILQRTLKHGSSTAIRKPSLSHDSQLVAFTSSGENTFQVKTMKNSIAKPVGKSVGKSMRQLKGTLKVNVKANIAADMNDELQDQSVGELKEDEAEEKVVLDQLNNGQFNDEVQGIFSPTENYLLTLNKSRNKLTLWQSQ